MNAVRCAIYTRKSTEEGLDKEFNTLEAQRKSGENYVKSRSIAWAIAEILQTPYGGKLPDERIYLAEFERLDKVWNERGDYFDGVFDSVTTIWTRFQKSPDAAGRYRFCNPAWCGLSVTISGASNGDVHASQHY